MKNVGYDEDDFDDDYDSPDPEEQEYVEECTKEVQNQLRSGEPSVTATREEVQEALWHYYNDVGKSVNYLRSMSFVLPLSFFLFLFLFFFYRGCDRWPIVTTGWTCWSETQ